MKSPFTQQAPFPAAKFQEWKPNLGDMSCRKMFSAPPAKATMTDISAPATEKIPVGGSAAPDYPHCGAQCVNGLTRAHLVRGGFPGLPIWQERRFFPQDRKMTGVGPSLAVRHLPCRSLWNPPFLTRLPVIRFFRVRAGRLHCVQQPSTI